MHTKSQYYPITTFFVHLFIISLLSFVYHDQGCQIFRFLRKISAFRLFFRIFSAVPLFSAFREFFDALSINRFQETIRKKRIFLGKSMTITMQSLQNHWTEIDMENFLRRSRKDSTYQP